MWTDHKYEIALNKDKDAYVKRDGIEWPEVRKVSLDFDANVFIPILTLECYARVEDFIDDQIYFEDDLYYRVKYDKEKDIVEVYRGDVFLEECVAVEVGRDNFNDNNFSFIRLTLIADGDISYDFNGARHGLTSYEEFTKADYIRDLRKIIKKNNLDKKLFRKLLR